MLQGGAVSAPPLPPGTTGSTTQMPASSYNHINEMIRHKERELQQIQDIRNAQLENMLEERDRLLVESSRRFEQLKEDFTYNLQLIEARDQEMERLEHQLQSKDQDIQLLQDDIKSLTMKIEHMNKREIDKMQKAEQERGNHKKIFDELKAVIESIQFSAEEENKHKQMEIDKLKKDLDVLYQSKEHALELQRKDLTNTFEQILQQREEQYQTKENDIQSQIQCIDTRFEKLQTENIFFKEQCRDYKAKYEHAIEASQQKDDKIRQLTYQVEDERNLKTSLEDSFTRQSHQQQQEIQRLIDLRMKEKMDAENALEQVKHEAIREREFRAMIEKRLEDLQVSASNESTALQQDLTMNQQQIHRLQQELTQLTLERDQLFHKLGQKRVEFESLSTRSNMLNEESERLQKKVDDLQQRLQQSEASLTSLHREHHDLKQRHDMQSKLSTNQFEEQLQGIQSKYQDEIQMLKKQHQQQLQQLEHVKDQEWIARLKETEVSSMEDHKHLQHDVVEKDDEIRRLRQSLNEVEKTLHDEKVESEAQKLRMKVQEQQLLSAQQEVKELRNTLANSLSRPGQGPPLPALKIGNSAHQRTLMLNSANTDYSIGDLMADMSMPSPMNSEDFNAGTFSIPSSPMVSYTPQLPAHYQKNGAQPGLPTVEEHSHGSHQSYFSLPVQSESAGKLKAMEDLKDQALTSENERLKKIIKEMRQDIEQLQTQMKVASTPMTYNKQGDDESKRTVDDKKVHQLENRLEQSKEEIQRLRSERKKLMETGTELRSALMKLKQQQLFEAEDVVEHMREKNINTIYRWMEDGNNEDASDISHDDRRFTNINQQRNAPRENYQQSASPGQRPYRNAWDDNYDRHARQVPLAEVDVSDYQEVNRPALRVRSKSPTKRLPNENIGARSTRNLSQSPSKHDKGEIESKGQSPDFVSDQNFEIIGERVNQLSGTGGRRQGNYGTSTKPKMAVSSSYLLNRGGPVVVPVNNSGRATNSQAQALQKLKETKVVKVSVASRSAVESKPSRMVPNYAKLAHDEGFSSSTA